jgi:hypothetical protein
MEKGDCTGETRMPTAYCLGCRAGHVQEYHAPYVFIHIPKCGGISITRSLNCASVRVVDGVGGKHAAISHPAFVRLQDKDWTSLSVVRNPWARMVSYYNWRKIGKVKETGALEFNDWIYRSYVEKKYMDVPNWPNEYYYLDFDIPFPYAPCSSFLKNKEGKLDVDIILKLEEIEKDWPPMLERLRIDPKKKLLHLNSVEIAMDPFGLYKTIDLANTPQAAKRIKTSKSYRDWYTSESKDIIKIAFQEDLDLFGYKF